MGCFGHGVVLWLLPALLRQFVALDVAIAPAPAVISRLGLFPTLAYPTFSWKSLDIRNHPEPWGNTNLGGGASDGGDTQRNRVNKLMNLDVHLAFRPRGL